MSAASPLSVYVLLPPPGDATSVHVPPLASTRWSSKPVSSVEGCCQLSASASLVLAALIRAPNAAAPDAQARALQLGRSLGWAAIAPATLLTEYLISGD